MQQLSNYLQKLSRGALDKPAYEFKYWALPEAKSLIPFDSCVCLTDNKAIILFARETRG